MTSLKLSKNKYVDIHSFLHRACEKTHSHNSGLLKAVDK